MQHRRQISWLQKQAFEMAEKKIWFSAKPKTYLNLIVLKYRMLNKKNLLKFFACVVTFFTDPYKGTSVGQG